MSRSGRQSRLATYPLPAGSLRVAGLLLAGLLLSSGTAAPRAEEPTGPLARPLPTAEQGPGAWDRLDYSLREHRSRLRFETIDGHRLRAFFYPAAGEADGRYDRLIVVPDVYQRDLSGLEPIIANLKRDFHVVLMVPRGHLPSDLNYYGRRRLVDDLARSPESSAKFLNDYRSLLKLLARTDALPGRKGRTCILAGKFHSTVLLLEKLEGVDCLVLLSPNPQFFERELTAEMSDEIKMPVLMINDERTGFRLRPLEEKLPAARLRLYSLAGVGMAMLHRRPEIIDEIRAFLRKPAGE